MISGRDSAIMGIYRGGAEMVERLEYLETLKMWREEKVIKVVTGIRRCG